MDNAHHDVVGFCFADMSIITYFGCVMYVFSALG